SNQFLAKRQREPLKSDKPVQYLFQVAALLTSQQSSGVESGDGGRSCMTKRFREQFSVVHALTNVLQDRSQMAVLLAAAEQFQPGWYGQTGANEGQKLLIKNDEVFELEASLPLGSSFAQQATRLDRRDQQSLLGKAVAHLGNRSRVLDVLRDMSPLIGGLDEVFRHALLKV